MLGCWWLWHAKWNSLIKIYRRLENRFLHKIPLFLGLLYKFCLLLCVQAKLLEMEARLRIKEAGQKAPDASPGPADAHPHRLR